MAKRSRAVRRTTSKAHLTLLVACMALSIALCVWGTIGWRRAYRAQSEADHLTQAEQFRDTQLLRIVVRGGEAAAQMTLQGESGVFVDPE